MTHELGIEPKQPQLLCPSLCNTTEVGRRGIQQTQLWTLKKLFTTMDTVHKEYGTWRNLITKKLKKKNIKENIEKTGKTKIKKKKKNMKTTKTN